MDLWLYFSFAGFALSSLLWFIIFHKYRSSGELPADNFAATLKALESSESKPAEELSPIADKPEPITLQPSNPTSNIPVSMEPMPVTSAKSIDSGPAELGGIFRELHEQRAIGPSKTADLAAAASLKSGQSTTGASPAVVYLQNLKEQLEVIHKDLESVKLQMASIGQKTEVQYTELVRRMDDMKRVPPSSPAAPAPTPQPVQRSIPEPAKDPGPPRQAAQEPPPTSPEPKKGPVWPTD